MSAGSVLSFSFVDGRSGSAMSCVGLIRFGNVAVSWPAKYQAPSRTDLAHVR